MATPTFQPYSLQLTNIGGPYGLGWYAAWSSILETLAQQARYAVRVSFPQEAAKLGASDALTRTGLEMKLPRAASETADNGGAGDTAYAQYLLKAFTTWSAAGTDPGILEALRRLGWTNARLYHTRDFVYSTVTPSGGATGTVVIGGSASFSHTATITVTHTGTAGAADSGALTLAVDGGTAVTYSPIPTSITWNLSDGPLTWSLSGTFTLADSYAVAWTPTPPDGQQRLWARYWLALGLPGPLGSITTVEWGGPPSPGFDYGNTGIAWGGTTGTTSPLLWDSINLIWNALGLWQGTHAVPQGVWLVPNGVSLNLKMPTSSAHWLEDTAVFYNAGTSGPTTAATMFARYPGSPVPPLP